MKYAYVQLLKWHWQRKAEVLKRNIFHRQSVHNKFHMKCLGTIAGLNGEVYMRYNVNVRRSQWPRVLRRRSAAARVLRLWIRIPPGGMDVGLLWVLSGRGLCDELITRSEESYRLWCVVVCDLETLWMKRPCPTGGCRAKSKQALWLSTICRAEWFCDG
jgi:hypothetical protein